MWKGRIWEADHRKKEVCKREITERSWAEKEKKVRYVWIYPNTLGEKDEKKRQGSGQQMKMERKCKWESTLENWNISQKETYALLARMNLTRKCQQFQSESVWSLITWLLLVTVLMYGNSWYIPHISTGFLLFKRKAMSIGCAYWFIDMNTLCPWRHLK